MRGECVASAVVLPLRPAPVLALAVGAERAVGAFDAVGLAHVEAEEVGAFGLLRLLLAATAKEFGNSGNQAHRLSLATAASLGETGQGGKRKSSA